MKRFFSINEFSVFIYNASTVYKLFLIKPHSLHTDFIAFRNNTSSLTILLPQDGVKVQFDFQRH